MTQTELTLSVLAAIYCVPWVIRRLLGSPRYLPLVVVQIMVGLCFGPTLMGNLVPSLHASVFTGSVLGSLSGISTWAVILFVWLAGVELDWRGAWSDRGETIGVALLALLFPLAFGSMVAFGLTEWPGWSGFSADRFQAVLGIGMSCAVTALPILVLLLSELGILRSPFGQRILRYASLDDLVIWMVLAVVLLEWDRLLSQLIFVFLFVLTTPAYRGLMKWLSGDDRFAFSLIFLTVTSLAADWSGLHYIVGAFLAGLVTDKDWLGIERSEHLRSLLVIALMPVFFLMTGLRTDWSVGGANVVMAAFALLSASIAGKLAAMHLAARVFGWPAGEASKIGWLLQTKALITIIYATILLDKGVITGNTFSALLLMAIFSTLLTMPMYILRSRESSQPLR